MIDAQDYPAAPTDARDGRADTPAHPAAGGREPREAAAERWVAEYGDVLWRFALARTRSAQAAEEIVQDTMLAAMQGFEAFAGQSSERTWLLGIAAHKVADHFRRSRRRKGHVENDDGTCACEACRRMFTAKGLWRRVGSRWRDPADGTVEKTEQLRALRGCIDALPPGQGEALWMRDVLGVPAPAVCEGMGLTPTGLWTRLHRARLALRTCMEEKIGQKRKGRT